MGLAKFKVVIEVGHPTAIVVNGAELDPAVYAFAGVRCEPGALPVLVLEVAGEGTIQGEGVAVLKSEGDEIAYMRQFVQAIDPQEWERRSAAHAPTMNMPIGQGMKEALLEMIDGS